MTKEEKSAYNKAYRESHKERRQTLEFKTKRQIYRASHKSNINARKRKREKLIRQVIKQKMFEHYGQICICCGQTNLTFLTIDHIKGGGNKRKKEIGKGYNLYKWIIKNNFPDGFRVLCYNCNCSRGHYGYCPHDLTEKQEKIYKTKTHAQQILRKEKVFNYYGWKCVLCGELYKEFLTIDHINGGGSKHKKQISGHNLYFWLIRNNFPSGFRTLCFNCNCSKASKEINP